MKLTTRWLAVLLVVFLASCDHATGPETGPVFAGTVYPTDIRWQDRPGIAGVEVRGTAVRLQMVDGWISEDYCEAAVLSSESTTTSAVGTYELMLPMELGTMVCLTLEGWKDGAKVGTAKVLGYVYDEREPRLEEIDLTPHGTDLTIIPITRPKP